MIIAIHISSRWDEYSKIRDDSCFSFKTELNHWIIIYCAILRIRYKLAGGKKIPASEINYWLLIVKEEQFPYFDVPTDPGRKVLNTYIYILKSMESSILPSIITFHWSVERFKKKSVIKILTVISSISDFYTSFLWHPKKMTSRELG